MLVGVSWSLPPASPGGLKILCEPFAQAIWRLAVWVARGSLLSPPAAYAGGTAGAAGAPDGFDGRVPVRAGWVWEPPTQRALTRSHPWACAGWPRFFAEDFQMMSSSPSSGFTAPGSSWDLERGAFLQCLPMCEAIPKLDFFVKLQWGHLYIFVVSL